MIKVSLRRHRMVTGTQEPARLRHAGKYRTMTKLHQSQFPDRHHMYAVRIEHEERLQCDLVRRPRALRICLAFAAPRGDRVPRGSRRPASTRIMKRTRLGVAESAAYLPPP